MLEPIRCGAGGAPVRRRWVAAAAAVPLLLVAPAAGAASDHRRGERLSDEHELSRWSRPAQLAPVRRRPDRRARIVDRLRWMTEDARPELYLALRARRDRAGRAWVKVRLPRRPNGSTGWVPRRALGRLHVVRTALEIDRDARRISLRRRGRVVWSAPVGHGAPGTPTPAGRFYVREKLRNAFGDPLYGPWAIGTSAYSKLSEWPGGGVIGIHGTNQPYLIPGRPSHGCVRLLNRDIAALARRLPLGTPIWIH